LINRRQKFLVHHYARAARLEDPTYRNTLRACAGVRSCADKSMSQAGFEEVMAALEAAIFDRAERGIVPDPVAEHDRYITSRDYWRRKLPDKGRINSRQLRLIDQLWMRLAEFLPAEQYTPDYLARIIHKSTGRDGGIPANLTRREAGHLIDALSDRLNHAFRDTPETVPF